MNWIDASRQVVEEIDAIAAARRSSDTIEESVSALRRIHDFIERDVKQLTGSTKRANGWTALGAEALGFALKTFDIHSTDIHTILVKKQRDYGPENIARYGETGLVIRTHDKIARLENLVSSGVQPENESVMDTYIDIVGYSAIAVMWERDMFLLPME